MTWNVNRCVALAAIVLGLVACQPYNVRQLAFQPTPKDTVSVRMGSETILVGGSATYCPTSNAKRPHTNGVTVTLRPCTPNNNPDAVLRQAGLLLVSILDAQELVALADADGLHDYFNSEEGRRALSNDGDAASVEVLGTLQENGVFFTHTRHTTGPIVPDLDNVRWRGFFVVRNRLLSISILSFVDRPVPDGIVFAQLSAFADRMKILNP